MLTYYAFGQHSAFRIQQMSATKLLQLKPILSHGHSLGRPPAAWPNRFSNGRQGKILRRSGNVDRDRVRLSIEQRASCSLAFLDCTGDLSHTAVHTEAGDCPAET